MGKKKGSHGLYLLIFCGHNVQFLHLITSHRDEKRKGRKKAEGRAVRRTRSRGYLANAMGRISKSTTCE